MKPLRINLAVKRKIKGRLLFLFIVLLAVTTGALSLANVYDYYSNTKVIKTYRDRLAVLNRKADQKRAAAQQNIIKDKSTDSETKKQRNYMTAVIKKNLFPLSAILSELEKLKQEQVDINEISFADNLQKIIIKGASENAMQASRFIVEMDRSEIFKIALTKEEIDQKKRIIFELTAEFNPENSVLKQ